MHILYLNEDLNCLHIIKLFLVLMLYELCYIINLYYNLYNIIKVVNRKYGASKRASKDDL